MQGKQSAEVKKELEAQRLQREAEQRRKEKEEDARARQKIKDQLEKDKADRKARFGGGAGVTAAPAPAPAAPAPAAQAPAAAAAPPRAAPTSAELQIRLTDGGVIKGSFGASDTLAVVKRFVVEKRTDAPGPFALMTPLPRRVFTDADLGQTLLALGLCPKAALTVTRT